MSKISARSEVVAGNRSRWLPGLLLVLSVAVLLRVPNLSHEPIPDELYHLLAAESWNADGTFAIADGAYPRAGLFTRMVARVLEVSDGDLDSVRLFCVALGTLFVLAVYAGVRATVGRHEAMIAALMLALMPGAIFLSQFIRFYSLHALVFWLAALLLYAGLDPGRGRRTRIVALVPVLPLLAVADHLQASTKIGVLGLATWLAVLALPAMYRWFCSLETVRRFQVIGAGVAGFALVSFTLSGTIADLVESYRSASLWSIESRPTYYAVRLRDQFGLFWSLFPVAAIVALWARPRPAGFCISVFGVAFILHSFAGMRSERYLFYAMPFFFMIWGIALAEVVPLARRLVETKLVNVPILGSDSRTTRRTATGLTGLLIAWAVLLTPATELAVRMALNVAPYVPRYWFTYSTSWSSASEEIRSLVADADIFLTSQGHHALYFVGDFDIEISATGLSDFQSDSDGSDIDPRHGKRVIADPAALQSIMSCHESGIVVIDNRSWRRYSGVSDAVANVIESHMTRLDTPGHWGLLVFEWRAAADEERTCQPAPSAT